MRGFVFLLMSLGLAGAAPGQQAATLLTKAPPDVDEALRARIKEFYELQSQGKFRQAESVVCENSKEAYYGGDKRKWTSFEIQRIDYESEFQKAKAAVALGTEFTTRAGRVPTIFPFTSQWQIEGGTWCYFIPPLETTEVVTPFGVMRPGARSAPGAAQAQPQGPPGKPIDPAILMNAVRATPREIRFAQGQSGEAVVTLENSLEGRVLLNFLPPPVDGLTAKIGQMELGPHEKTTLTVTYKPGKADPPTTATLAVRAEPVGQSVPIKILFSPPAGH